MKKKIIFTICFVSLFSAAIHAEAFKIGENRASFGMGFGWKGKDNHRNTFGFPSPNVLIERSILPFKNFGFLSVGAQFGFHHSFNNKPIPIYGIEKQSWTSVYFVPRIALYFHEVFYDDDFPENIDLYGGIGFGFNYKSHKIIPTGVGFDESGFQAGYHFFVGGRYYFKKQASVFAEIGYGLSFLNVGFTIRY